MDKMEPVGISTRGAQSLEPSRRTPEEMYYKNNLFNNDINNMSFLENTNLKDDDDNMDDLDDFDLTAVPVPDVNTKKQINEENQTKKKKTNDNKEGSDENLTRNEKRAALRKKVAEMKKKSRNPQDTSAAAKKNLNNVMKMPGMDKLMETMMKGNNLEKIMKEIPQDKLGVPKSDVDINQMKKLIQSINNKK